MAELVDGILEHVGRIEALIHVDGPSPCLVYLDEREENIELVGFLSALRCAPAALDFGERRAVIFLGADRPDFHEISPSELRHSQSIDAVVLRMRPDELHKHDLPAEIECSN